MVREGDQIDPVRLQDTLDDIVGSVEWAAKYLDSLMESGDSPAFDSDLPGLQADLERLRVVADALVPGRVVDQATQKRWFLAGDDAAQRSPHLSHRLDAADRAVEKAFEDANAERTARALSDQRSKEAQAARDRKHRENVARVGDWLAREESASAKQIAVALGEVSEWEAERCAQEAGAKRGRDRKFRLPDNLRALQPHTDSCADCSRDPARGKWGLVVYAADGEQPDESGTGYVAFYHCERGHNWHTGWAEDARLTPAEVEGSIRATREALGRIDEVA